jgi:hypothetical protein
MRKLALWGVFAVVVFGGLVALPLAFAGAGAQKQRADCPGKVVCPLTGEEVCKDQCPLAAKKTASTRADCPGQVECPLTGELVCKDQCPVGDAAKAEASTKAAAAAEDTDLPPCCRKAKK